MGTVIVANYFHVGCFSIEGEKLEQKKSRFPKSSPDAVDSYKQIVDLIMDCWCLRTRRLISLKSILDCADPVPPSLFWAAYERLLCFLK